MRMTRPRIQRAAHDARVWFRKHQLMGSHSTIHRAASFHLRSNSFVVDYSNSYKALANIDTIYDSVEKHWAETDGKSISLNLFRDWKHDDVVFTLIHEAMHYMILRQKKYPVPEEKEHRIMLSVDKRLV